MEYIAEKELAHNIIRQACQDYVKYQLLSMGITRVEKKTTNEVIYEKKSYDFKSDEGRKTLKKIRKEILDCLDFFRSEWFEQLAGLSGFNSDRIITRLNALIKKYVDEYHEYMRKEGEQKIAERSAA